MTKLKKYLTISFVLLLIFTYSFSVSKKSEDKPINSSAADEGITRGESHFPRYPERYIPLPIPESTETENISQTDNRWISYNTITREEIIHESPINDYRTLPMTDWVNESQNIDVIDGEYIQDAWMNEDIYGIQNFSSLSLVNNPEDSPWCRNVKLFIIINDINGNRECDPGDTCGEGSGVLIDAMHVLTAGHCIHSGGILGDWYDSIVVVPAYENTSRPYGDAYAVELHSWGGWITFADYDHDIGVIDLDRPIGALAGWNGYGYNDNPDFYTGNTFHNPGYPGEAPYNGEYMYYWFGNYDSTDSALGIWYGNEVRINSYSYGGQSGSGAYYISNGSRIVYTVLSNGASSWTDFPRITSDKFINIRDDVISVDTPSSFDLIPLDVTTSPSTIAAGSQLSSMSYVVHNYSSASWSGTVYLDTYLSTNNNISTSDTFLRRSSFYYSFSPKSSVRVNVSSLPTIPAETDPGDYFIGVILDISDFSTANNDSDGQDASPLYVYCPTQSAPSTPNASDGTYSDRVYITWNSASGASSYQVYRNTSSSTSGATGISGWQSGTSFNDYNVSPGITYYYWVKAQNSCGNISGFSSYNTGYVSCPSQVAPTGVSASDGTYSNRVYVTWNSASGASSYQVYRNTSSSTSGATAISGWQSGTSFNDYNVSPGITYYYWVKAQNSCGNISGFSSYNTGYVSCPSQAAPTGVAASDGTYTDKVRVTWNAASGATSYQVYRNTTNNSGAATPISGWLTTTLYDDTSAAIGTTYYYWVKAQNGCGNVSGFSSYDTGYRGCPSQVAPTGVAASDGTYTDRVRVTWNAASGATSYQVYRNTTNDSGTAAPISSWITTTLYDDTSAAIGTTYYYWVKAQNGCGNVSSFSSYDTGFIGGGCPDQTPPTSVSASDGTFTDKVRVTWDAASGASSYQVYRNTTNDSVTASPISGWIVATLYDDTSAAIGTTYHYWVKAQNSCGNESDFSPGDTGYIGESLQRILIIDLDGNSNSAAVMQGAIEANGYETEYLTSVPQEINPDSYPMTFVCLGIYFSNHVLTTAEGDILKNYLDNSGSLYMEGGDTWAYDLQTSVHPYFGIQGIADGTGDTANVTGVSGTFTQGLDFIYGGDNSWMDHIDTAAGASDAFIIWDNQSPAYHNGVARATGSYKTIGVSFEFGGIPTNKQNIVMEKYLHFLNPKMITVTSPNGGESLAAGSTHEIAWTSNGPINNVIIEYSSDGGSSWLSVAAPTPNTGSYEWLVPNTPSDNCLMRIGESSADSGVSDVSDALFSIASTPTTTITVTSPNGGENLDIGSVHQITWTSTGDVGSVRIECSTDRGVSWNKIVPSTINDGSFDWTVADEPSNHCLVRISESDKDGGAFDVSDAPFSIVSPLTGTITVTSPNGGETWPIGSIQQVSWNSIGDVGDVRIQYSTDGGASWLEVIASTANDGSYGWIVPNTLSGNCRVQVSETDGNPSDVSDKPFSIVLPPSVTITSPNGGESLMVGSTHEITWTSTGDVGDLRIEYSTDSGTSWKTIVTSTTNDGSYNWTVANDPSSDCLVRIGESDSDSFLADVSDAVFSIVSSASAATITVTSPNGGENLTVGSTHEITWTSTGIEGDIKIEYSTDNGNSWTEIVSSTANDGSHDWPVPDSQSQNCLIRVSDIDGDPADVSDAAFSIVSPSSATIAVTSPNGGESLTAGLSHEITWEISGDIDYVIIEYSTDGGVSWANIATAAALNGSHGWTIPDTQSDHCLVRITESDTDVGASDMSDAEFSIVPSSSVTITVTSPNGGESLVVGSTHEVTWTSSGALDNVMIEYSIDGGTSWITTVESTLNDGIFEWTVPDSPSDHCLVQIKGNESDEAAWDVSDTVFSIVPDVSSCGSTWSAANYPGSDTFTSVAYGNSKFAAVGNGGVIMTSSNGVTWTPQSSGTINDLTGVTYGDNKFAAVGGNGAILTGPDGTNWVAQTSGINVDLQAITYGNNQFAAVGVGGTILTSTDGTNWESQASGTTNDLRGITYGSGQFVAVGDNGVILTSLDGINWNGRASGTSSTLNGITYGDNMFAAVGDGGVILTSSDGTSWNKRTSILTANLLGIASDNATFVVLGEDGKILTSPDGISWTSHPSGVRNNLLGIVYNNSRFVAVGEETILYTVCNQ